MDFRERAEEYETIHGESFVGAILFVFANPPYSKPRVRELEQSAYDSFTTGDIKDIAPLCNETMKWALTVRFSAALCSSASGISIYCVQESRR